jgi:threonine/homoserine/homoserine lactone efflux protein
MEGTSLVAFALVSLVGIATPGPDVMLAMSNGSRHGVRRALVGIAGVAVSDLFLMSAVAFGLGAILAGSELFFIAVKLFGMAYLAWVGVKLLRSPSLEFAEVYTAALNQTDWQSRLFRRSFLVAFTNIKVWLFFAAFLPQFVDLTQPQIPQYLTLALIFETLNVAVLLAYATLGSGAMRLLKGNTATWMDRISGVVLLLLALGLAFYQYSGAST